MLGGGGGGGGALWIWGGWAEGIALAPVHTGGAGGAGGAPTFWHGDDKGVNCGGCGAGGAEEVRWCPGGPWDTIVALGLSTERYHNMA